MLVNNWCHPGKGYLLPTSEAQSAISERRLDRSDHLSVIHANIATITKNVTRHSIPRIGLMMSNFA